jgi:3-hydroxybutyryl-CoA dehydratase
MPSPPIAEWTFEQLREGQDYSFEATVAEADIDAFAVLTGDANPLHMIKKFAVDRGYENRVIHGALLAGLVSRLVGVHLPGKDCLLQELALKFVAPAYAGDRLTVKGVIDQWSEGTRAIVLRVQITCARGLVARGKAIVGFTQAAQHI